MNRILLFIGMLFIPASTYSQEFYVNTFFVINFTNFTNGVYRFDVSGPTEVPETYCTQNITANEISTDIAIDSNNNLYYVTNSGLLYRKKSTSSICEFLGDFTTGNAAANSLVADSGNYLYAAGTNPNALYRYDINNGTFTEIGNLSDGQTPSGDLFFYESRLFLTTADGIVEINLENPTQSCPFMAINTPNPYAAFSIDYGTYSKAYLITYGNNTSTLSEIDMVNKQIGAPIRTYNHLIYGAAARYNLTSTNTTCSLTPLHTQETSASKTYFNVNNPANGKIICNTNIERNQMIAIQLFDNSGRLTKDFSSQNNIESLNISNLPDGVYILVVTTKKGEKHTKKIIIKS
ncbi:hypothetical protein J2795_003949 [Chryseobacterium bernardetii]|uniref:Uncharacterized protein n=2 Tax=Chryseobacterium TaxID=59732 RepID=A0ACC6IZL9_9FLAO|nr:MULTISPECIES: T9SS type A sorting domain-containing protein [Chryseobacterium]MDR6371727.1 hypothetical protein [Chryseobacterium vietnamense]MDR6443215.1 hypothetical protein [Chryseobacterium bernardetii]TQM18146.1 putative secreted protein (Por secretion system target) [Chryseobacterium aquifrigidense]